MYRNLATDFIAKFTVQHNLSRKLFLPPVSIQSIAINYYKYPMVTPGFKGIRSVRDELRYVTGWRRRRQCCVGFEKMVLSGMKRKLTSMLAHCWIQQDKQGDGMNKRNRTELCGKWEIPAFLTGLAEAYLVRLSQIKALEGAQCIPSFQPVCTGQSDVKNSVQPGGLSSQ